MHVGAESLLTLSLRLQSPALYSSEIHDIKSMFSPPLIALLTTILGLWSSDIQCVRRLGLAEVTL